MRIISKLFIFAVCLIGFLFPREFDFRDLPVQENGRIKPMDTFVRNQLLAIYGKRTIKSAGLPEEMKAEKLSAIDWFFDISTNPDQGDKYRIFNIRNPEVVGSLDLNWSPDHLYNRNEVLHGLQNQLDLIKNIHTKSEEELTQVEKQILEVYQNVIRFQELSYSFSCLLPNIQIKDQEIAQALDIHPGKSVSYFHLMRNAQALNPLMQTLLSRKENKWNAQDKELNQIIGILNEISQDQFARILKIIPPESGNQNDEWLSPWDFMEGRPINKKQGKLLSALEAFLQARLNDNVKKVDSAILTYKNGILSSLGNQLDLNWIQTETWTNEANLFYKSISLYILAFLLLALSWIVGPVLLLRISFSLLLIGIVFHTVGIYLRIMIMQRPPVSTLYESIIFVSLIAVICAAILEYNRKDGLGLFVGSICGAALHFVAFGYADDGDTLGMLVAVLNSNFWLATHVTTITTGYGTSLFAGLLGHVYLLQVIRDPSNKKYLKSINKNMFGATIFALFFTLFGTILGGIWADQSWGRFWGWDPKENGALLIVMWQVMMVHMRITGLVRPTGFALGMILNNIVVILAWFGVNLLSIGLHSYGFASGIARNISIFIALEIIIGFGTYFWAKDRRAKILN